MNTSKCDLQRKSEVLTMVTLSIEPAAEAPSAHTERCQHDDMSPHDMTSDDIGTPMQIEPAHMFQANATHIHVETGEQSLREAEIIAAPSVHVHESPLRLDQAATTTSSWASIARATHHGGNASPAAPPALTSAMTAPSTRESDWCVSTTTSLCRQSRESPRPASSPRGRRLEQEPALRQSAEPDAHSRLQSHRRCGAHPPADPLGAQDDRAPPPQRASL